MSDTVAKTEGEPIAAASVVAQPAKPSPLKPAAQAPAKKPAAPKPAMSVKAEPPTPRNIPARTPAAFAQKETKMADTIKTMTDKTQTMFAEANDRAKGAMEKGAKAFEDMNAFGKGNIEAMVESSKIAAKGAEEIAKYSVDYAKGAVEKANANVRKLSAIKSPTEFFQLQNEFAREAMDAVASEGAKFTENYLKLLGQIAQPYQNRFAVAAEKIKVAA